MRQFAMLGNSDKPSAPGVPADLSIKLDILKVVDVWVQRTIYEPEYLIKVEAKLLEASGFASKEDLVNYRKTNKTT